MFFSVALRELTVNGARLHQSVASAVLAWTEDSAATLAPASTAPVRPLTPESDVSTSTTPALLELVKTEPPASITDLNISAFAHQVSYFLNYFLELWIIIFMLLECLYDIICNFLTSLLQRLHRQELRREHRRLRSWCLRPSCHLHRLDQCLPLQMSLQPDRRRLPKDRSSGLRPSLHRWIQIQLGQPCCSLQSWRLLWTDCGHVGAVRHSRRDRNLLYTLCCRVSIKFRFYPLATIF